jgi:hypothetical protein
LFTSYKNINKELTVVNNNYHHHRRLYSKRVKHKYPQYIVFIGQPLDDLVDINFYIDTLTHVTMRHKESKFIYIPHRLELGGNVLEKVTSNEKIIVLELKANIELWLLEQDFLPETVYTFISSAAVSLRILFPKLRIISIHIPEYVTTSKFNKKNII